MQSVPFLRQTPSPGVLLTSLDRDPFPPTNVVFHAPAIYAQEQALLFDGGWTFAGVGDAEAGEAAIGAFRFRGGEGALREYLGADQVAWFERLTDALGTLLFEVRMPLLGNWKLVVSGAIEDYHLPFVHKRSVEPWRTEPATPTFGPNGHSTYATVAHLGPTARALHRTLCGGARVEPTFANTLTFPNLLTIRLWGLTHVTTFTPEAPDRTLRTTRIYAHDAPSLLNPRRAARAVLARGLQAGMGVTFREDQAIVEEAHWGTLAGRDLRRGPAHVEEARVEHFLAEVGRRLRGARAELA